MKESVIILMEAAGVILRGEDMSIMSLDNLLERFVTGTEKAKAWGQRGKLLNSSAQGPIEMLSFESPTKKAKVLKDSNKAIRNRHNENITCRRIVQVKELMLLISRSNLNIYVSPC